VRHLVELHGGSVEAESQGPGRGSTFTVHLPATAPATLAQRVATPPEIPKQIPERLPALTNLRIVVVDDDPNTREVLSTVLVMSGAEVITAESSTQALALIDEQVPDVIIADVGMPGEDGYTFIQKVRGRLPEAVRPPAIALTSYARIEDRDRAIAAGFQRHIPKPFDPRAVVLAVTELVAPPP
jgi:CheY-like chemotaxis protein